jgi:ABC-type uncharacterized transport system substrate-binding protein
MIKILIFLILSIKILFAHPHTFIEVYPTIEVKNNKTTKIHFKWMLDEMTSSMLIMEFDQDGDGKINKKESFFVYGSYFTSLRDYNFYTDIKVNGKTQIFPKPKNFRATIEKNKICYSFDIEENYSIKDLKFDFGDEDFFVAMILKDKFTNIKGAKAKVSDLDNDFYFGYRLELESIK